MKYPWSIKLWSRDGTRRDGTRRDDDGRRRTTLEGQTWRLKYLCRCSHFKFGKWISVKVSAKGWYQHFWFPYRTIVQYSPKLWQHQEYLPISKHKLEKRCPGIHSWNLTLAVGLQMKLHVQLFLKIVHEKNFLTHKILLFWSQYHSVLGLVLTFNISTIRETLFFRCGIVIRIILNAYFPPLLSLPFT